MLTEELTSEHPSAWSGESMTEKKTVPVVPGFMPLKVTKCGVCQKLANLRQGLSKRSIRMHSGSAAWLSVNMVGKSVILSIERGG